MGVRITLTPEQHLEGAQEGYERQVNAIEQDLRSKHDATSAWEGHIEGACAELAASIVTGLPWTGKGIRHRRGWPKDTSPDLGAATEVRWERPKYRQLLTWSPSTDYEERFYVLVVGLVPTFEVIGYARGCDMRRLGSEVVYPERTVYRVPVDRLTPMPHPEPARVEEAA